MSLILQLSPLRASTTSAVLATLDDKLSEIANRTVTSKKMKDAYEKQYQGTLKEVVDKQKEARNANRPVNNGLRTEVTPAGQAERERELERQRERERKRERERENKDDMDVDDPTDVKGKGRK